MLKLVDCYDNFIELKMEVIDLILLEHFVKLNNLRMRRQSPEGLYFSEIVNLDTKCF